MLKCLVMVTVVVGLCLVSQEEAFAQSKELGEIRELLRQLDQKLGTIATGVGRVPDSSMTTFDKILLGLTAAYVVGTFALFAVTMRQTNLATGQLGLATKQLKVASDQSQLATDSLRLARESYEQATRTAVANSLQQIGANDRAIKSLLVSDPSIYDPLDPKIFGGTERLPAERRLNAYFGLVINHVKHVYLQEQLRQLYPKYWEGVDRDLDVSMRVPAFRSIWKRISPYQPEEFRIYMDRKVAAAEQPERRDG